ncbi:hypothetical protein BD626DRAFT_31565 [Schizophyllum amplum]|uniref:F-box domain-containing protein n=1 Tax=Schizophyllum amplum TaxID=97359 RepID=A0A550D0T0_9AGAR|nr:hypothetical protein BD626DRAFT_31565 [Auriculariopsis ampla]
MHVTVLQTEELRAMILDQLELPSLGSLAATCKELHEPALCVLWSNCDDFTSVLRLLPASAWSYRPGAEEGTEVYIKRPLEGCDAERICQYAKFVRRFELNAHPDLLQFSPSSLADIMNSLGGDGVLFPNLRDLDFFGPSTFLFSLLRLVTSSTTKLSICLMSNSDMASVPHDLASTQPLAPSLETILFMIKDQHSHHITTLRLRPDATDAWIADLLSGWDALEDVQVMEYPNVDIVLAALVLPCLRTLVIRSRSSAQLSMAYNQDFDTPLLKSMDLHHLSDITFATNVLGSLRNAELVEIRVQAHAVRESLQNFFLTLPNCCTPRSLRVLSVTSPCDLTATIPLSRALLLPIFLFVELTDLQLDMLALPRLESLSLIGHLGTEPVTPKITISALIWLARYCSSLKWLSVLVDATSTRLPDGMIADCTQNSLTYLNVCHSPISSHLAVASFLSRFFPSLRHVFPRNKTDDATSEWWRVGQAIPVFVEARTSGFHDHFYGAQTPLALNIYD